MEQIRHKMEQEGVDRDRIDDVTQMSPGVLKNAIADGLVDFNNEKNFDIESSYKKFTETRKTEEKITSKTEYIKFLEAEYGEPIAREQGDTAWAHARTEQIKRGEQEFCNSTNPDIRAQYMHEVRTALLEPKSITEQNFWVDTLQHVELGYKIQSTSVEGEPDKMIVCARHRGTGTWTEIRFIDFSREQNFVTVDPRMKQNTTAQALQNQGRIIESAADVRDSAREINQGRTGNMGRERRDQILGEDGLNWEKRKAKEGWSQNQVYSLETEDGKSNVMRAILKQEIWTKDAEPSITLDPETEQEKTKQ